MFRKGPYSGFLASLRQVDLQYFSPTLLLDQHGREVHLVHGEPKLLQKKLDGALDERREKQIIESVLKREEVAEQETRSDQKVWY